MSENDDFDKTHISAAPTSNQPPSQPGSQGNGPLPPSQDNGQPRPAPYPQQYGRPPQQPPFPLGAQQHPNPYPQQYGQPNPYYNTPAAPSGIPARSSHGFMTWVKQDKTSLLFGGGLALVGILLFFVPLFTWFSIGNLKGKATITGTGHVTVSSVELGDSTEDINALQLIKSWAQAFTSPTHTMLIWTGIIFIVAGLITALTASKLGDVIAAVSAGCMAVSWLTMAVVPIHKIAEALSKSEASAHAKMGSGVIIGLVLLVAALAVSIVHLVREPSPSRRMVSMDHL